MLQDALVLLGSSTYVFTTIGVAEGLCRWRVYAVDFIRKFTHVAVGVWAYGTVLLFWRRTLAIVPPLAFIAINGFPC